MRRATTPSPATKASAVQAGAQCACGTVRLEIDVPARWAWHDHSEATRRAMGAAFTTYVGSYRSRFRVLAGEEAISRFEDAEAGTARSFCAGCGTPVLYERARAPTMVNIPRAIFTARTGREPRYHMHLPEAADWTWMGEALAPLKGYPGVMWERPRKRKPARPDPMF
jgi:hypothetical protein